MTYIPLNPDKTPAVAGWNKPDYHGPYEGEYPPEDTWVGLRADGLVIIDCDSLRAAEAWNEAHPEETFCVKTPRGVHFYYLYSPGSPTGPAVGVLPGVDVRAGSGSYVVSRFAPGYKVLSWGQDTPPGGPESPLIAYFDPSWLPARPEPQTGTGEGWSKIPEGQRNDTLAAIAGTLRAKGMDGEEIAKSIYAMNKAYCDPPLPNAEILVIAKSISRYEPDAPTTDIVLVDSSLPDLPERASGMWGHELERFQAPPITWVVEDLIPEGLTILAGKPKVGKSWMSLGLAAAVAEGGEYLGRQIDQGTALYLALEDTLPRLKRRLQKVQGKERFPAGLRLDTIWPKCPDAATQIVSFMKDNPDTRLVVIDTLAKVRHEAGERQRGTYQDDYAALGDLKQVADAFHIGIVVVHHLRKGGAEDPLDEVSGTTGLAGAADTILVLKEDLLQGRGRDLEEDVKYDVLFEHDTARWKILGDADFAIVLDLAVWVLDHTPVGDIVNREAVERSGLWSQAQIEAQWAEMRTDPRFTSIRNDDDSPIIVAKPALNPGPFDDR